MMINFEEFLNYSNKLLFSKTLEEAWVVLQEALKPIGFEKIIYMSSHFAGDKYWGDPKDTLVLSNHNDIYNDLLLHNQIDFLRVHPNFEILLEKPGSFTEWKTIDPNRIKNKLVKNLISLNNRFKINNGIQFSLEQIKPGSACIIMLTGKPDISQDQLRNIWMLTKDEIIMLSKIFQLSTRNLPYTGDSLGPVHKKLTTRQLEILNLLANGDSIVQISKNLNLSIPTIDKHLKLARLNLDVTTSAQAVSKALTEKMLFNATLEPKV